MAETPSFKIQYEYQNPNNVESEVPGSQNIREVTEQSHVESTDGAEEIRNGGYTITRSSYTEQSETVEGTKITRTTITLSTNSTSEEVVTEEQTVTAEMMQTEDARLKSKIPRLKFRQAAERVRRERRLTRAITAQETHIPVPTTSTKLSRHSKIPPPTSKPIVQRRDSKDAIVTRPDEEFDKIYEEIVENTQTEIEVKHPEIIESKFEEIIHDYDENNIQPINVEKIRRSRIPSLRRRSSEHAETNTIVLTDRPKSRSLPRLKEISMRVKADNEGLEQVKCSRSLSTEKTIESGQKRITETRIIKSPEVETKISKLITTENIKSGKELNKTIEGSSKSVKVHRTVRVTSQGEALVGTDKSIDQSINMLHTENIMQGSINIGYPTFNGKITENINEVTKHTRQTNEHVENEDTESKTNTSDENKITIKRTTSNSSETTSTIESNIATKVSVTQLASNYETVTGGAKESEITEYSPAVERTMTVTRVISSSNNKGQENCKTLKSEKDNIITRNFTEVRSKIPTIGSSTVNQINSSNNDGKVQETKKFKSSATEDLSNVETIATENVVNVDDNSSQIVTNNENKVVESPSKEYAGIIKNVATVRTIGDVQTKSPAIKRSLSVTRTAQSNNVEIKKIESNTSVVHERDEITKKNANKTTLIVESPTIEHDDFVKKITTKRKEVEVQNKYSNNLKTNKDESNIVTIENKVTNTEETIPDKIITESPTKEYDEIMKKITTVRKVIDFQNKSPSVERSTSVMRSMESNNIENKEIETNKVVIDAKEDNTDKSVARKTIITAISKQMRGTEHTAEITVSKKDTSIKSYEVDKESKSKEITQVTGKVGMLIDRIHSSEETTDVNKKDQFDEMPKKKSVLSKIAMFERHDIEDKMPKKKPENLPKLIIKHSSQKTAHLHTPTIVEEVLKSHENSPLSAKSHKDFSHLKLESVKSPDYELKAEINEGSEYTENVNLIDNRKDYSVVKSESVTEYDYQINADEYKQTVEMSKIKSSLITKDFKNSIATTDYNVQDIKKKTNNLDKTLDIRKDTSIGTLQYDVSAAKPDLISAVDADIKNTRLQYEQENQSEINESLSNTANSYNITYNRDDNAVPLEPSKAFEYQFKGVNRLTSEYERRTVINKNTILNTKDVKIDSSFKPESIKTTDYKVDNDMTKITYANDEAEKTLNNVISDVTDSRKNISLTPEPVMTLDYTNKVDIKKQGIDYDQLDKSKVIDDDNKDENHIISNAPTVECTFKDVKRLATEYEQKVEITKNRDVTTRRDILSPSLLNYDSKYTSKSTESLGKVMTDAPVILISPKFDFQTNTNTNKPDDKIKITTTWVKEATTPQDIDRREKDFMKQVSTEYREAKIDDENIWDGQKYINVFERSTSQKTTDTKNYNLTSTNESNSMSTQSFNKISSVNWIPKGSIVDHKMTSKIQTSTTKDLDSTQDSYNAVKTTKLKGYVIKQEGDLAYARIQEEAEVGDEIQTFKDSRLPRTLAEETSSTVTKKSKNVEEKKKYYADVDINTVIKGKVSRMISRMTSVDTQGADKKAIDIKEMPRKMSVLEKIAMFESKASAGKIEYSYGGRTRIEKAKPQIHNMTQEEFEERVTELKSARLLYGRIEDMPSIVLRNGVEMPVLALGTATLDTRLVPYVIGAAIDLGYRAIDTAYIYGNEKEIGEAIRAKIEDGTVRREELFIISKLWSTYHRTDLVEKACRSSLDAMGLEYFDLYLIHNPMSFKEGGDAIPKIATVVQYSQFDYLDAWYGMEKLMAKGLVRSIGVSNFNSVQLQRILDKGKIKPTVNQVECHPYLSQQKLDTFCEERDIMLTCFGVLGSKGTPAEYKSTLPPVIDDPLVQVMASGLDVSPAQLLIRYQLDSGRTTVVMTSSAKHLWDNLQALTFTLTVGQVEALQALNRNKRTFIFKGMGDTHKNYPFKIAF